MPPPLKRVELWSAGKGDGGAPIAVIDKIVRCETSYRLEGNLAAEETAIALSPDWDPNNQAGALVPRRVLHYVGVDDTFRQYRISDITDDGSLIAVRARGMIFDLAERNALISETVNGVVNYTVTKRDTPANVVSFVLGFAPTVWALGTVTPTDVIEVTFQQASPLAGLLLVAEAASRKAGTTYELSEAWDEPTGRRRVSLTVLNSTAPAIDVRLAKNLVTLTRIQSDQEHLTRAVMIGTDGRGVGDNWWQVSAVSVDASIRVVSTTGGISPLAGPGALNGLWVVDRANGTHQITASSAVSPTECELAMTSTTNISVGDWVRLAEDSAGAPLRFVRDPSSETTYGINAKVLQGIVPGITNWVLNGDLSDWPGASPTNWTIIGTAPTRTTTPGLWLNGGQSAYFGFGSSVFSQSRTIYMPAGPVTYVIRLQIKAFDTGPNGRLFLRNPQTGTNEAFALDGSVAGLDQLNTWLTFSRTYSVLAGSKTFELVLQSGLPLEVYFDSAQFVLEPAATPFIAGSGGAQLIQGALHAFTRASNPPTTYRTTVLDLTRYDAVQWPYDMLLLGGTANISAPGHGITVSARLVSLVVNELDPLQSQVEWSTRRPELTAALSRVLG